MQNTTAVVSQNGKIRLFLSTFFQFELHFYDCFLNYAEHFLNISLEFPAGQEYFFESNHSLSTFK